MRENLLLELINSLNPDVIFLQEIKCQDNEFPLIYKEKNYNLVIKGYKFNMSAPPDIDLKIALGLG